MDSSRQQKTELMTLVDHEYTNLLLNNKFVVVLGPSTYRSIYKDLVLLLQEEKYLSAQQLRTKGELSFEGDCLVEGGNLGEMHNGTGYREVRQFRTDHHLVRFYFVTRAFSRYMESILEDLRHGRKPDVLIINSCVWDISRYGPKWRKEYKENLHRLFGALKEILPEETLVIWNLATPLGKSIKGGFLVPEIEQKASQVSTDVMEANFLSLTVANKYGIAVLDLHYHFRHLLQHRTKDGVHWDAVAHRRITSLLIQRIAEAWNVEVKRSVVNVGHVQFAEREPAKFSQKRSERLYSPERQPAKVRHDGYRPEFISDSLPRSNRNFEYPARWERFQEPSLMFRRPLPPPPHPSLVQRHPDIHSPVRPGYDERPPWYDHQPYREQSHQATMRRSHARHHYAPYERHHPRRQD